MDEELNNVALPEISAQTTSDGVPKDYVNKLVMQAHERGRKSVEDRSRSIEEENARLKQELEARDRQTQEAWEQDFKATNQRYRQRYDEAVKSDPDLEEVAHRISPDNAGPAAVYVEKYAGELSPKVMAHFAKQPGGLRALTRDLSDPALHNQAAMDIMDVANKLARNKIATEKLPSKDIQEPLPHMSSTGAGSGGPQSVMEWRTKMRGY